MYFQLRLFLLTTLFIHSFIQLNIHNHTGSTTQVTPISTYVFVGAVVIVTVILMVFILTLLYKLNDDSLITTSLSVQPASNKITSAMLEGASIVTIDGGNSISTNHKKVCFEWGVVHISRR